MKRSQENKKNGGNRGNQYQEADSNNYNLPTQEELANMIGISVDTLQNYKKLTELVPELQDWIETGIKIAPLAIRRTKLLFHIHL